jgi:hypothetical protein
MFRRVRDTLPALLLPLWDERVNGEKLLHITMKIRLYLILTKVKILLFRHAYVYSEFG